MKKHILSWIIAVFSLFLCLICNSASSKGKIDNRHYPESYAKKAEALKEKGNYIEAIKVWKRGLKRVNNKYLEKDIIYAHGRIIDLFLLNKRIDMAIEDLNFMLELINRKNLIVSKETIDCAYYVTTRTCEQLKDPKIKSKYYQIVIDSRKQSLKEALRQPVTKQNIDDILGCFHNTINILRKAGHFDEAIKTAKDAINFNKKYLSKDISLDESIYSLLANVFVAKKDYSVAIEILQKFLKLSKDEKYKTRDIRVHFEITWICIHANDFPLATKKLEIISRLTSQLEGVNKESKGTYFTGIGNAYSHMGQYELSLFFFKKALACTKTPFFIKLINDDIKNIKKKMSTKK